MNPPSHRLRTDSVQATESNSQNTAQSREFASIEEAFRTDAANIQVPAVIEERLAQSIAQEPPPTGKPWWKRMFGS